jgi:Choline/ethanolamine kinase
MDHGRARQLLRAPWDAGVAGDGIGWLAAQIDALEARLTRDHANWLGFCHNDLQCGNVMLDASSLESLRGGAGGAAAAAVAGVPRRPLN